MEEREGRLWFLFQFLHDVEEEMSKEEQKQVMIEKAINLKLMCDYVVSCSYLDIVLIICMLRDYVQMVDEIRVDDIQWSAYYRDKFLKMADRLSEQIEYDYDAAKERCLTKRQREEDAGDVGEEMYTVCQKCGKKLTDPESMRRGYGPECWSQISGISTADSGGPVNEDELPGQMTIFDFPDAIPEGGQNG